MIVLRRETLDIGPKVDGLSTSDSSCVTLQVRSQELNGARTELLEDLKTGFQKLPVEVVKGVKSRDSESVSRLRDLVGELFDLKLSNS